MTRRTFAIVGIALVAVLAVTYTALAQTGALDVPWFSVDGGGGTSTGGEFTLSGSIGQPDAGTLSGGEFTIRGGFQAGFLVAVQPPDGVCGDLNDDELVNVFDAIIALQIIVGKIDPSEEQQVLGDVVRNGAIDVFDVVLMLRHIVGKAVITECGPPSN